MTNVNEAWCAGFIKAATDKGYSQETAISLIKQSSGGVAGWAARNIPSMVKNPGMWMGGAPAAGAAGLALGGMGRGAVESANQAATGPDADYSEAVRQALLKKLQEQNHPIQHLSDQPQHAFGGLKDGFMSAVQNHPYLMAGGAGAGILGGAGIASLMNQKKKPNTASSEVATDQ